MVSALEGLNGVGRKATCLIYSLHAAPPAATTGSFENNSNRGKNPGGRSGRCEVLIYLPTKIILDPTEEAVKGNQDALSPQLQQCNCKCNNLGFPIC